MKPNVSRGWPVSTSVPTRPERQPEQQADDAAQQRCAEQCRDCREGEDHQREIFRRAEEQGELDEERRQEGDGDRAEGARHEGADRGGRKRRGAAALPGHEIALDRRHDRPGFARRIEQDRGRRAAIHGAVIEAGEHDEGAGRIELCGNRQKQGDGQRRPDAGKDADRRAERHADQAPEQIDRCCRRCEAVHEGRRTLPRSEDSGENAGRQLQTEPAREAEIGDQSPGSRRSRCRADSVGCRARRRRSGRGPVP